MLLFGGLGAGFLYGYSLFTSKVPESGPLAGPPALPTGSSIKVRTRDCVPQVTQVCALKDAMCVPRVATCVLGHPPSPLKVTASSIIPHCRTAYRPACPLSTLYPQTSKPGDYDAVRKSISAAMESNPDYDDGSYGPLLVRLAWHASGTYDKASGSGGSNGGLMR